MLKGALVALAAAASSWCVQFEPNRGQTAPEVEFYARTRGGTVFLTRNLIVFGESASLLLRGANHRARWEPAGDLVGRTSYFVGRDPKQWAEDVPAYGRVRMRGVYPGIDLELYENDGRLEYDFIVAPGADPSEVRLRINAPQTPVLRADGSLAAGAWVQRKPVAYQLSRTGARIPVHAGYRLNGRDIGFAIGIRDPALPLVIDPVIESSAYIGGIGDDRIVAVGRDGSVVGTTTSIDFPGAQFARRRGHDIFVQRPGPQGPATLVVGGTADEHVTGAAFMSIGVAVTGYTSSRDLPTQTASIPSFNATALQRDYQGGETDGFALLIIERYPIPYYTTYLGTPGDDRATSVACAENGGTCAFVGTTTGRGLPPYAGAPTELPEPAGGLDGFLLHLNVAASTPPQLRLSTYFGGTGDDRPLTVMIPLGGTTVVAGETTSPDFPASSESKGGADAFVMRLDSRGWSTVRFGGSGDDRITGLLQTGLGEIAAAGTTSSQDLPTVDAPWPAYAGGDSDAFLARWAPNLSAVTLSTYFGGSGADEASSLAYAENNIYLAGSTTSTDLPVVNAVQPAHGGGRDDGFFVHLDRGEDVHHATYFGGSGNDRINSMASTNAGDFAVFIAGETTSPDLPQATGSALAGPSDGFVAKIATNLLRAGDIIGVKGFRSGTSLYAGRIDGRAPAEITVTSTDSSKVRLALQQKHPAADSIVIRNSDSYPATWFYFYADCLVDEGGADVRISSPGYDDTTSRVNCYRPALTLPSAIETRVGRPASEIMPFLVAEGAPPSAGYYREYTRQPDLEPAVIRVESINPAVARIDVPSFPIGSLTPVTRASVHPVAFGTTELAITAPDLGITDPRRIPVTVGSPLSLSHTVLNIPSGFQAILYRPSVPTAIGNFKMSIESGDPSRVLLSTDAAAPGKARIEGLYSPIAAPILNVQALASEGEVPITVTLEGYEPQVTTVVLSKAVAAVSTSRDLRQLSAGEVVTANVSFRGKAFPAPSLAPLPSTTLRIRFEPDDSAIVTVEPSAANTRDFRLRALKPGSTNILLRVEGVELESTPEPLEVRIAEGKLSGAAIEAGKDLAANVVVNFPFAVQSSTTMKVATADPSLALVSQSATANGAAEVTIPVGTQQTGAGFYVHALKSEGTVQFNIEVPPFGTTTATATLRPSGFGWNIDSSTVLLYGSSGTTPRIVAFALDPGTLIPVATQALRPGVVPPVITVASSDPNVAVPAQNNITLQQQTEVRLQLRNIGDTTLTFEQPAGFTAPARRQQLRVRVDPNQLRLSDSSAVARDTVVRAAVGGLEFAPNNPVPVTVTSADPSRLLISREPAQTGEASITFDRPIFEQGFYLHGLAEEGEVAITASAPNYKSVTARIRLLPPGIGVYANVNPSSSVWRDGKLYTTPGAAATDLVLRLEMIDPLTGEPILSGLSPRPGAGPWNVDVRSSNPAVATVNGSPATLGGALPKLQPVGLGEAEITVAPPPGFRASQNSTIKVVVVEKL